MKPDAPVTRTIISFVTATIVMMALLTGSIEEDADLCWEIGPSTALLLYTPKQWRQEGRNGGGGGEQEPRKRRRSRG